ncbi:MULTISPECIES: hypothetical protein [unclassified Pseudomonas]|uniref:hypothetical protein n=1 Tax=unclassified Pseudomonas TaxID=196821 RepID=UPI001CC05661|nr:MULTISPECIES: hypothetical protein [unclassified Pseudomonas]
MSSGKQWILRKRPVNTPSETAEAPIQPTSTPLNVLVVDDHPANRLLMCQQLDSLA